MATYFLQIAINNWLNSFASNNISFTSNSFHTSLEVHLWNETRPTDEINFNSSEYEGLSIVSFLFIISIPLWFVRSFSFVGSNKGKFICLICNVGLWFISNLTIVVYCRLNLSTFPIAYCRQRACSRSSCKARINWVIPENTKIRDSVSALIRSKLEDFKIKIQASHQSKAEAIQE